MRHNYPIFAITMLLGILSLSQPVRSQCLSLELLDHCIASGRITPDSLMNVLALSNDKWMKQQVNTQNWVLETAGNNAASKKEEQPIAWVGLRYKNQESKYYDLIYKTTQLDCVKQLRYRFRQRAKLISEPITCVQCDGERLIGEGYTVSIFYQHANFLSGRAMYPYVIVIRRNFDGIDDADTNANSVLPTAVSSKSINEP